MILKAEFLEVFKVVVDGFWQVVVDVAGIKTGVGVFDCFTVAVGALQIAFASHYQMEEQLRSRKRGKLYVFLSVVVRVLVLREDNRNFSEVSLSPFFVIVFLFLC
jgi:uncharacterized membrane protein